MPVDLTGQEEKAKGRHSMEKRNMLNRILAGAASWRGHTLGSCWLLAGLCAISWHYTPERAQAQQQNTPAARAATGGPVAQVLEPSFNFGTKWAGETLDHTFQIRNVGNAPLQIVQVRPSCGCTIAGHYPTTIAPGQSGSFPFKLRTARFRDRFTKTINITTNDPNNKVIRLTLTGEAKQYVETQPPSALFGILKHDEKQEKLLILTNRTDSKDFRPRITNAPASRVFSGKITPIVEGVQYELAVTASPPYDRVNRFDMEIDTNIPKQKSVTVVCLATVPERVELQPETIVVPAESDSPTMRISRLTNSGDTAVHLVEATSNDENLIVDTNTLEEGRRYELRVGIPAHYEPKDEGSFVIVTTDDTEFHELRLPVSTLSKRRSRPIRPALRLIGQKAPASETSTYDGQSMTIGGHRERPQVVVFYTSWCPFCKRAIPMVKEVYEKYRDKDLEFVAVNLDQPVGANARTKEASIEHYRSVGLGMPLVLDPDLAVARPYRVISYPTIFLIGRSGDVEAVHIDAAPNLGDQLSGEIETLLAGKTRKDFPAIPAEANAVTKPSSDQ